MSRSPANERRSYRSKGVEPENPPMTRSMKEFLKTYEEGWQNEVTEEYKTKHYKLQQEVENLKRQKHELQVETTDVIEHLRKECEQKDRQIEDLKQKKIHIEHELERSAKDIEYVLQNEIINLKTNLAHKDKLMKEMEEENEMLNEYKMHRAQYAHDIEHYKHEIENIKSKHKDKIARLERKFYDEKISLQKQFQQKLMELRRISHEEAVTKLGETTKQLFVENRTMTEELSLQLQTTEKLKVKQKELEAENKRLAREVEIQDEKQREMSTQQNQRTQTIRKLTDQVGKLTESNETLKLDGVRNVANTSSFMRRELEDSKLDIEGLKKLLELKTKDLKRIKKMARRVLEQRSQLEQFFLDAIEHVRMEIMRERQGLRNIIETHHTFLTDTHDTGTTTSLLPTLSRHSRNSTPDAYSIAPSFTSETIEEGLNSLNVNNTSNVSVQNNGLDIKEMSWEDKEKVLRMVFSRINGVIAFKDP